MQFLSARHSRAYRTAHSLTLFLIVLVAGFPVIARAQIFSQLYNFADYTRDYYSGSYPSGQLLRTSDGSFYGTTSEGGANNAGTLFKMDATGNVTTLHEFTGSGAQTDGSSPLGNLILAKDGLIYGACASGGASASGTLWKYDRAKAVVTVVHQFTGYNASVPSNSGGYQPVGGIIQASDGNFYGATLEGGAFGSYSALYQLTPAGSFKLIYSFSDLNDGLYPEGQLTEGADGKLYGGVTTGGTFGNGLLFRIDKTGANFTTLYNLNTAEGAEYNGPLLKAKDGNLYATFNVGGRFNMGSVLQLNPVTGKVQVIHSFNGLEGSSPVAGLTQGQDGFLYGTTTQGGVNSCGTAFKMDLNGKLTLLHTFNGLDAFYPAALIQAPDGTFYGLCGYGGQTFVGAPSGGSGTAYKMLANGTVTLLYSFHIQKPYEPLDRLIQAQDGYFYGIAFIGGAFGQGVVYRIDAAGAFTIVHSFNDNVQEGSYPDGGVIQSQNGIFYGTTGNGGKYRFGTIYAMTSTGAYTVLHDFQTAEGYVPNDALLQGADGALYGACAYDNVGGGGSLFRITPTGTFTVLHHFNGLDGAEPHGNLVQDATGVLYGVCVSGGDNGYGTVFAVQPGGSTTVLHSFNYADGAQPTGVTLATDGFLYGTCEFGGPAGAGYKGTLFKTDPKSGATTVLTTFSTNASGELPVTGILQGPDGYLYGTCTNVAPQDVVWKCDPKTGAMTALHSFDYTDGYYPRGGLVLGSDGVFYGTTVVGGVSGGNIYSIDSGISTAVRVTNRLKVTVGTPANNNGVWTAKITIQNTGTPQSAILGPIQFVLSGLPAGATLTSASGTVPSKYPEAGAAYQTAPGGAHNILSLAPGGTLTLNVKFNANPGASYKVGVYSGRF